MKLFIPGPVDVSEDVLERLRKPMIGHRSEEFGELLVETVKKLKRLMGTENDVFIATTSSTGLMEAAIRNCVAERCLCLVNGAFGKRWYDIAVACGKDADPIEVEWGKAITAEIVESALSKGGYDAVTLVHNETSTGVCNPIYEIAKIVKGFDISFLVDTVSSMGGVKIEVDMLGIDVCLFGTQKAMALPPGLAVCSVSERALEKAATIQRRGYYFDFLVFKRYWQRRQTPTTPALPQLYALNYQLDKIFEEGLEDRYARHRQMAEAVRGWAKKRFELFADEAYASDTVTCVKNSKRIDVGALINKLKARGYLIANGYGKLKGSTFRIAHMGDRTLAEVEELLKNMDEILGEGKGNEKN